MQRGRGVGGWLAMGELSKLCLKGLANTSQAKRKGEGLGLDNDVKSTEVR